MGKVIIIIILLGIYATLGLLLHVVLWGSTLFGIGSVLLIALWPVVVVFWGVVIAITCVILFFCGCALGEILE